MTAGEMQSMIVPMEACSLRSVRRTHRTNSSTPWRKQTGYAFVELKVFVFSGSVGCPRCPLLVLFASMYVHSSDL